MGQQFGGQAVERRVERIGRARGTGQCFGLPVMRGHLLRRQPGRRVLPGGALDQVQALEGRAEQALAFQGGADGDQGLQAGHRGAHLLAPLLDQRQQGAPLFSLPQRLVHRPPGLTHLQVGQLFAAFGRGAAVVGRHRAAVPADGAVHVVCRGAGHAKGLGHRAHAAPVGLEAGFQVADLFLLPRIGCALGGALHRQGLQCQGQRYR